MGDARLQWQVLKLHWCTRRCPAAAAVAGSQTARICILVIGGHIVALLQRQFLKLHTSALQSIAVAG
jgi:hypothetical protein